MALEIEKKFLVSGDYKKDAYKTLHIIQAYISSSPGKTVRIRIQDDSAFITIKGMASASGMSRFEWEKEISLDDAKALLLLAEPGMIEKKRYLVKNTDGIHTWEVDEFYAENEGLTVAEIELEAEDACFDKPSWLGAEVTGNPSYSNSMLSRRPFKKWGTNDNQ